MYNNGRIYTVDDAHAWAEAVAIKDGKFLVVGSSTDVERVTGDSTEVIDLDGAFAMPGIGDNHIHPALVMPKRAYCGLPGTFYVPTEEQTIEALKQCIENDPALCAKLLRVVNSSLFGLTSQVSDLGQALALLGTTAKLADVAAHADDEEERKRAASMVDLLTPVAKAFLTDLGLENTIHGQQVFGGQDDQVGMLVTRPLACIDIFLTRCHQPHPPVLAKIVMQQCVVFQVSRLGQGRAGL